MSEQDEALFPGSTDEQMPSSPPSLPSRPPMDPPVLSRKRTRASDLSSNHPSSDPAFFSSDDASNDNVENYQDGKRRKKQFRGAWWDRAMYSGASQSASADASIGPVPSRDGGKTQFTRNFDSGVWMGSDSTDASTELASSQERGGATAPSMNFASLNHQPQYSNMPAAPTSSVDKRGEAEREAARIVDKALEMQAQRVDLSGLNLTEVSDSTISPLHSMVRYAQHLDDQSDSPREYFTFLPTIQLFLSSNRLRRLPNELFNLDNITVLSLRNNKLTEIPSCIRNLRNLVELNVSGNKLRHLPYELLSIPDGDTRLSRLTILPNPFAQIIPTADAAKLPIIDIHQFIGIEAIKEDSTMSTANWPLRGQTSRLAGWVTILGEQMRGRWKWSKRSYHQSMDGDSNEHLLRLSPKEDYMIRRQLLKARPMLIASSPVAYLNLFGSPNQLGARAPSAMTDEELQGFFDDPSTSPAQDGPKAHSLVELALKECSASDSLSQLHTLLPEDSPRHVVDALDNAQQVKQTGGKRCSVCGRSYVIPRTEWIEYWHYVPGEMKCSFSELFVPFLRKGCSWKCVPDGNPRTWF
ncbi:hypothetical protein NA57DRAFT_81975 [Rhizodiscina lignyota]|uniref:Uncharacterized protein n=1 Tax=Rhizodiscina lignyota TaxID=1504668 RepID=A0A9P4I448_9PEZI|nr:hypothetical protein NA57DRAFT_81975 [Rhizodiscina lignyota]